MNKEEHFQRYQELQRYVRWTTADAERVHAVEDRLEPHFLRMVDDFYDEVERHPHARKVITGGADQILRLKGTLLQWLHELVHGPYDADYVQRRWRVGFRHVEIGLDQVYTNVALARLRNGLLRAIEAGWDQGIVALQETMRSLNTLIDLDLALIEDAYQSEYIARQQRSERLAAIGQVAGGVAHELRNPLNVIKTSVYYLLNSKNPSAAKTAEHLQRIERHVVLADGVITALSSFARMPVPELRPFSVADCVRDALETNPVGDSIRVVQCFPADLPPGAADYAQVRIVFANLIRNARDAMPQGGNLTLQGRRVHDQIEVSVADTGTGIPQEALARVMEPLYSTKARGLGLGLAIARAILDKNKGSLHVRSVPGAGSTFTVRLLASKP